jgi:hypothetical protein
MRIDTSLFGCILKNNGLLHNAMTPCAEVRKRAIRRRAIIDAMKVNSPVDLWGWCVVIFVAAFMPWGAVGTTSLFGLSVSSIVTGWSGYITLLGIIVPNWTVVMCASAIVSLYWLNASGHLDTSHKVAQLLAGYGILHAIVFIYSVVNGGNRIGIGVVITLVAFIAIFRRLRKGAQPVAAPAPSSAVQSPASQSPAAKIPSVPGAPGQTWQGQSASSSQTITKQLPDQDT